MDSKAIVKISRSRGQIFMLGFCVCLLPLSVSNRQVKVPKEVEARERVETIMRETLKRGEGEIIIDGIKSKITRRAMPSLEDAKEVRDYGDAGIEALARYLHSENPREQDLAIRFLGLIGGSRIVEPLEQIIRYDPSPNIREVALRAITQAPWDLASVILREASESDPDPKIRKVSKELLMDYAPK